MTGESSRYALVTGAASGIGRAVALRYARAGSHVIAFDQNLEGLEAVAAEVGERITIARGDVRDRATLERAVEGIDLDIIAAIAGVSRVGRVLEMSDDDRDVVLGVNLIGVWNTIKAGLPGLVRRGGGGRILVCGSIESILAGEGLAAYVAAKHGVLGLVKSVALELAALGITANVISPAGVDTDLLRSVVPPGGVAHIAASTPIPRLCTPDEVAAFFELLARPETAYMTGENVVVDGGLKLLNAHTTGPVWAAQTAARSSTNGLDHEVRTAAR